MCMILIHESYERIAQNIRLWEFSCLFFINESHDESPKT